MGEKRIFIDSKKIRDFKFAELKKFVKAFEPIFVPIIQEFIPTSGFAGSKITIKGENFSFNKAENRVLVGGEEATIITCSDKEIQVITSKKTKTGAVSVEVDGKIAKSAMDYTVIPYPSQSNQDGPPIYFEGQGMPSAGAPSTGTLDIVVALVNPSDIAPNNNDRQTVVDTWDDVITFYDQASFGNLTVNVDVMTNWSQLSGNTNDYYSAAADNIASNKIDRLLAEAAQAVQDDASTQDLDDYDILAVVINLGGTFIRAWGGMHQQNFKYAPENIDITLNSKIYALIGAEQSDWGRCAHEVGHIIVDPSGARFEGAAKALVHGEDVYSSDLIDPSIATAQSFDMMGSHNSHPLFSGFYMEQIKYYDTSNNKHIKHLTWSRNPHSEEFNIVAHGLNQNTLADRCHLVKLKVTDGLFYYIEVRQRPGTTTQVFDPNIPINGATNQGGVVVTKVLTDTVNMNQQMRFITLLHDSKVLEQGDVAIDPARDIKITVLDDNVVSRPQVCKVKIEWAQNIADDPNGKFDLKVTPWGAPPYETPDVWIDGDPYGSFEKPLDSEGRPTGNGDKPRVNEINHFYARIHNEGSEKAEKVKVTFYSVEPPGVGDNGNWAPLKTEEISIIDKNDHQDIAVNWTPLVGRHTCLKVFASQQLGEITGGNNSAQENVSDFEMPSSSVPMPVIIPIAVRNPLDKETMVMIQLSHVPKGYIVHFPHRWVFLKAKQEKQYEFIVIANKDFGWYRDIYKEGTTVPISISGRIPHAYQNKVKPETYPASIFLEIGGFTANITPKKIAKISIEASIEKDYILVDGNLSEPRSGEKVLINIHDKYGYKRSIYSTTGTNGRFVSKYQLGKEKPKKADLPQGHPGKFPIYGTYKILAKTINSPTIASTESNIIYLQYTI